MTDCELEDGSCYVDHVPDPHGGHVQQNLEFAETMAVLEAQLQRFGLDMPSVTAKFPSHADSRRLCIRIARQIASDPALYAQMLEKARLPGSELMRRCQVPLKTIEKNRSSIILLALVLRSDLDVFKSYIRRFEREDTV